MQQCESFFSALYETNTILSLLLLITTATASHCQSKEYHHIGLKHLYDYDMLIRRDICSHSTPPNHPLPSLMSLELRLSKQRQRHPNKYEYYYADRSVVGHSDRQLNQNISLSAIHPPTTVAAASNSAVKESELIPRFPRSKTIWHHPQPTSLL